MADYLQNQHNKMGGYEFCWGQILEYRVEQYLVWEFYLDSLLNHYLNSNRQLDDLQRAVFIEIESRIDCTTRDITTVLSMNDGWKIIPCSQDGVFTMVIHFTEETEARIWVAERLLGIIPDVIQKLSSKSQ